MPIRKHPQDTTGNQRLLAEKQRDDAKALELNNDDKRKLVAGLRSTTGQQFATQADVEEAWRGIQGLSDYINREIAPCMRTQADELDTIHARLAGADPDKLAAGKK